MASQGNAVEVLRTQSEIIGAQVGQLEKQKEAIDKAIKAMSSVSLRSGFGLYSNTTKKSTTKKKTSSKTKTKTKKMPRSSRSTMDMIRAVLTDRGEPMTAAEIKEAVKAAFGIEPSKSYGQMLYKRAHSGTGFFKAGKKYGVINPPARAAEAA